MKANILIIAIVIWDPQRPVFGLHMEFIFMD